MDPLVCQICAKNLHDDDQTVTVKQKGIETIVSASLQRKDDLHK